MKMSAIQAAYLASVAIVACPCPAVAGTIAVAAVPISISAQPLDRALTTFAMQTGKQILFTPKVVRGKRAARVQGTYTPETALDLLLAGTNLTWRLSSGGTYLIDTIGVQPASLQAPAQTVAAPPTGAAEPEPAARAEGPGFGDPIVVTARRREEDIQTVPVSVSAFTPDDLYNKGITNVADIQYATPGLQLATVGIRTNPTVSLRGQRRSPLGEGAPTVLIYFAEVPLPNTASFTPTFDLSSVQVLKGPQGTLFGRNTTAGAILFYPTAPNYDFEGYVTSRVGSYNQMELEGAVNLPLVGDRVALRLAGAIARRDGYTRNLGAGPDLDDKHDEAFRASLLVEPAEGLTNTTIFDYYHADEVGGSAIPFAAYPNETAGGGTARLPPFAPFFDCNTSITCDVDLQLARQKMLGTRVTFQDLEGRSRRELWGVTNTTSLDVGEVTFKNIFGYRSVLSEYNNDFDGTNLPLIDGDNHITERQITDEFQISGTSLQDRLDWIGGVFYLKAYPGQVNNQRNFTLFRAGVSPQPPAQQAYRTTKSKAVFAQIGYDLSALVEGLKINLGGRYSWDRQRGCFASTAFDADPVTKDQCDAVGQKIAAKSSAATWTAGLDYEISHELFAYFTTRRGYRSAGYNSPVLGTALSSLQSYDPEKVTDFEIGLKGSGRIGEVPYRFSIAAYRGDYSGIQRNYTLPSNFDGDNNPGNDPASGILVNSGKARFKGVEFSASFEPVDGFTLTGNAAYTDIGYRSLSVPPLLETVPGLIPANAIDGKFPYAPEWTAGATADYVTALPGEYGDVAAHVDFYWSDTFWLQDRPAEDIAVRAEGYTLVNARVGWRDIMRQGLDVNLVVKNMFDKDYVSGNGVVAPALTVTSYSYGAPRTWGVELRKTF